MDRKTFYGFACDLLDVNYLALSWVNLEKESYMRSAVFIVMDYIYGDAGSNEVVPLVSMMVRVCKFKNDMLTLAKSSKVRECVTMYLIEADTADDILDALRASM